MKRKEFKDLFLEWNKKVQILNENIDDVDEDDFERDLDDLGSSMGLSGEDYQDEPEDYDRYHKSAEMLSANKNTVDEIVATLEADPDLLQKVLIELGFDPSDIPATKEGKTPIDPDLV